MNRRKLLKYAGLGSVAAIAAGWWGTRPYHSNPYHSGPVSDHFDGRVFFNPGGTPPGSLRNLLRWQLSGNRSKWPAQVSSPFVPDIPPMQVGEKTIRVAHVGHASFLIQTNGLNFLTDPVWSERASPLSFAGPRRVNAPGIAFGDLPPIDAVLLTHSHYDHMDMATLQRLVAEHDPQIITPLGNDVMIRRKIPKAKTIAGDWGDTVSLKSKEGKSNITIHFDPCHHWGARSLRDRRMTLWCAFTIETPAHKIHHVGDTGFHDGIYFRQAASKHGGFDLAILPIGAYEPRWFMKFQHINPQEAVDGMQLLNAQRAIGHHWGTFQLTDEPVNEPKEKLAEALAAAKIVPELFEAAHPGQVFTCDDKPG